MHDILPDARRIVIKIGSALLVDRESAALREAWLDSVCADIAALNERGVEVIVVSSGAIALARVVLNLTGHQLSLAEKQAAASVGQVELARAWSTALKRHGRTAAQLLLTAEDTECRRRHLNGCATLRTLLRLGCIPIINENDAIATAEIRFGDNDRLGARVAQMIAADRLILFSDIDGLYTGDPRLDPLAKHIPLVRQLDEDVMAMGGAPPPGYSSGGMHTKLLAARIATRAGADMIITAGFANHPIRQLYEGGKHTRFIASSDPGSARKRWLASSLKTHGALKIDAGALAALRDGKSLLAAGVTNVSGSFVRGDLVSICDHAGSDIGYGLTAYNAQDAQRIAGHSSDAFEAVLGYHQSDELIHRDDLVML